MNKERIVAVGLLTSRDAHLLGPTFERLWPVDETPCFSGLLERIDEAIASSDASAKAGGSP